MFKTLFLLFVTMLIGTPLSMWSEEGTLSGVVQSYGVSSETSALMVTCLEDGRVWTSGRVDAVFSPASTSKIPHTLIALEEGYHSDTCFEWDGQKRFMEVWNQDQTLLSAFKNSALWVYQRITHHLGFETMATWMDRLDYGNRSIGSEQDLITYWVNGPLLISAKGQVEFISRIVREELPLRAETFREGRVIMREELGEGWTLYAKTGFTGSIGWYVGVGRSL